MMGNGWLAVPKSDGLPAKDTVGAERKAGTRGCGVQRTGDAVEIFDVCLIGWYSCRMEFLGRTIVSQPRRVAINA